MSRGRRRRRQPADPAMHGLLVVDKPLGWSSMDVVRRVRRAASGAKTGHAGTLDPLATGVVVCCVGSATKAVPGIMDGVKVYFAEVDLSAFTATDDREGERTEVDVVQQPAREAVEGRLRDFVGDVDQIPPQYSAVHVDGQRAYKLARAGQAVDLPVRTVRIDAIDVLDYAWPILTLRITCGKGTYIRSLARDLGQALGVGGHLASLRRERVGEYTLEHAITEDRLAEPITPGDLLPVPE